MEVSRRVNPAHLARVRELCREAPFMQTIGARLLDLSEDLCRMELFVSKRHMNAAAAVHGGVYAALLDNVTFWCLYCGIAQDAGMVTLDVNVSDLGSVTEGRIVAEGKALKYGRSICLSEGSVRTPEGRLLAYATSKCIISPAVPSLSQAVVNAGQAPLPPKFL